jgi:Glycosyltransferase family 87
MIAIINLSAAIVIASWPDRRADLDTMRRWSADWVRGRDIYAVQEAWPEYPPHAIVMLSPVSALPGDIAVPAWAAFNLILAPLACYLAVRICDRDVTLSAAVIPMLVLLSWGGFRALLQFSLLSLVFGLLSVVLAERRPVWSGIFLGLGLMKPQVCVPFLLWAALARRFRTLAMAGLVVVAGFLMYCLKVDSSPLQIATRYAAIVRRYYIGDAIMYGLAQPRPLIELLISDAKVVDAVALIFAAMSLAMIIAIGMGERRRRHLLYAAPPLAALWSLLTFYHLTYGFVILLPLSAALLFESDPETVAARRGLFWALQLSMMFDLTVLWRWFGHLLPAPAWVGAILIHADRVIIFTLFACVAVLAVRRLRTAPTLPNGSIMA